MGLYDNGLSSHPDDPATFAQDNLHQSRLLIQLPRQLQRARRRLNLIQAQNPTFGLRHDLMGYNQDIVVDQGDPVLRTRRADQAAHGVSLPNLSDTLEADDLQPLHLHPERRFLSAS